MDFNESELLGGVNADIANVERDISNLPLNEQQSARNESGAQAQGTDFSLAMNIEYFKDTSTLADSLGIPLTNRFMCLIEGLPGGLEYNNIDLQVISVDTPSFVLETGEMELNGLNRYYFKGRRDSDLRITFLESSSLRLRNFFYQWMKYAVDINDSGGVYRRYFKEVVSKCIRIAPLDFEGKSHSWDKFLDVFPTNIEDLNYNYSSSNEIIKCTVTFKYGLHLLVNDQQSDVRIPNVNWQVPFDQESNDKLMKNMHFDP